LAVAIVAARSFTPFDAVEFFILIASAADLGDNNCGGDCADGVVDEIFIVGVLGSVIAAFVCDVLLAVVM
jgi:hypothetical protein